MSTTHIVFAAVGQIVMLAVFFIAGHAAGERNADSRIQRLQRDNDRLAQRDRDRSWKYNQSTAIARALCSQETVDTAHQEAIDRS